MRTCCCVACAIIALATTAARAEIRLPNLIGHHMVLQRDDKFAIWGWAEPGETITVTFRGKSESAAVQPGGQWKTLIDPGKPGGPFLMTIKGKTETIILYDILVGDVWFCTGQSNMQMATGVGEKPMIRLFRNTARGAMKPCEDTDGAWKVCGRFHGSSFSAVGYYFARDVNKELGIPIGMIYGLISDPVQGTPPEDLAVDQGIRKTYLDRPLGGPERYEEAIRKYHEALVAWVAAKEKGDAAEPPNTYELAQQPRLTDWPGATYNSTVAPLRNFPIKGVLYYQGEAATGRREYARVFPLLIQSWRKRLGNDKLPFIYVQLPLLGEKQTTPADDRSEWPHVRDAQIKTLKLPHTMMAIALDVGDPKNIHPANKEPVGQRAARAALATVYGKDIVPTGPVFDSMKVEGGKVRLTFKYVGEGLVTNDGGPPKGFVVAGAERKWGWADAKIEGKDTVILSSNEVEKPVFVRYAWADNPIFNLYNKEGLPAAPFGAEAPAAEGDGRK